MVIEATPLRRNKGHASAIPIGKLSIVHGVSRIKTTDNMVTAAAMKP